MSNPLKDKPIPPYMKFIVAVVCAIFAWAVFLEYRPAPVGVDAGFKNLLVVTFDTTRADRIGAYGYPKAKTPNLDRMAKEGVLFERCLAVAPITLPSHTSILTGLYPYNHGARNNGTHHVPDEIETLAETLSANGFATGATVSALVLDSRYGLDQGFDHYDDNLANATKAPMFMFRETKALDTSKRAVRWLQDRGDERWFMWVHFFDPHANYDPPEEFAMADPYDGEISYADAGLGELMSALNSMGKLDQTLVVMTADHGDSMGEHGESTHGMFVYDATTRVPLLMRHPSLAQGMRVPDAISSVDIVPTALDLLDIPATIAFDGVSTADAIRQGEDGRVVRPPVYQEAMNPYYNHGWSDLRALRDNGKRYVRAPREELYDLFRDGRELNNLLPGAEAQAETYQTQLGMMLSAGELDARGDDIRSMDPDMREALAEMGYVWSSDTEVAEDDAVLKDPKDMAHMWERSQMANQLVRADRLEEAESMLRSVLAEDPDSASSASALVGILMKTEREDEALEILRQSVNGRGVRNGTFVRLAGLERKMGFENWKINLEAAKARDPRDPMPHIREGDWAQDDDLPEEALACYYRALEIDDRAAKAWIGIGNTEHRKGNEVAAEKAFRKALECDPIAYEAWYDLGVVAEATDRTSDAEQSYLHALELEPEHLLALVNLANLYMKSNQFDAASTRYEQALAIKEDDFKANYNYGLLQSSIGKPRVAAALFGRACKAEPTELVAWSQRMRACRAAGMWKGCLEAADVLLGVKPNSLLPLVLAAISEHQLGHLEPAQAYLRRALEQSTDKVKQRAGKDPLLAALLATI
ncbi:MAG: sulfatase-like hydrolase/transferase [Planctomycetes bacterium]|nr:sulfatase-like hydrolase/transferase [Planctomycetota bacterium]